MVSLWPFKADATSAAAFEKTLSQLATKITAASTRTDRLRQRARKVRVSWTLYGGFTYILVVLILIFVTGQENWAAPEYTSILSGPLLLYGVRQLTDRWYNYRIGNAQEYLDGLLKERDATIEKLKAATKYDSTQQLLDKYGSTKPTTPTKGGENVGRQSRQGSVAKGAQPDRVFIQPPPTANIQRPPTFAQPPPGAQPRSPTMTSPPRQSTQSGSEPPITEEFAPNAFTADKRPQLTRYTSVTHHDPRWYDRILDALLGEDETQSRNRFALICSHCRLVNGQAPPGVKSVEEIGRWRCAACKDWNGVENETEKLVDHARKVVAQTGPDKADLTTTSDTEKVEGRS